MLTFPSDGREETDQINFCLSGSTTFKALNISNNVSSVLLKSILGPWVKNGEVLLRTISMGTE